MLEREAIKRFGDPAAPRWRVSRAAKPILAVAIVFALVTLIVTTTHWVGVGDLPHILGSIIGIVLVIASVVAGWVSWSLYWRPLKQATVTIGRSHPSHFVIGARLPGAPKEAGTQFWPTDPAKVPRRLVVLVVNSQGLSVFDTSEAPRELTRIGWSRVGSVAVVECVEGNNAFDVIAIIGPSEHDAILLQVMDTRHRLARFSGYNDLVEIVSAILARRA